MTFFCPGCHIAHTLDPVVWHWNQSMEKPTFAPSILVTWVQPVGPPTEEFPIGKPENRRCHSYVIDGNIKFLNDCYHELRGQTVPLPEADFLAD